jgi:hypothetical protein
MGSPQQVAQAAASEHRHGTFCGRHPVLSFVAMPVIVLPLLWVAALLAAISAVNLAQWSFGSGDRPLSGPLPAWQDLGARILFQCIVQIPIVASAAWFCHLAKRAALPTKWTLITCGLLALVSSLACVDLVVPTAHSQGHFTFGLGLSKYPKPLQIGQFALPLLIGGLALWRDASVGKRQQLT